MRKPKTFTLEHPAVQATKVQFERSRCSRQCAKNSDFDSLYKAFEGKASFKRIGEERGLSREMVRLLYNRYFRKFFRETGQERLKAQNLIRRREKLSAAEKERLKDPVVRRIAARARRFGLDCEVARLPRRQGRPGKSILLIGGHLCSYRASTKVRHPQRGAQLHLPFTITRKAALKTQATIFVGMVHGFSYREYIVPNDVLFENHFRANPQRQTATIYMRIGKNRSVGKVPPRVDYSTYKNAWRYLKSPQHLPVPA